MRVTKRWSEESVILTIQRRYQHGWRLSWTYVHDNLPQLYNAAKKYFKGWRQAVVAAGTQYNTICDAPPPGKWNRQKVLEEIKRLHAEGRPIYSQFAVLNYGGLYSAALDYCGSWGRAVEAAGISYATIKLRDRGKWTKRRIIEEIHKRLQAGKSLHVTGKKYGDKQLACLVAAAQAKFGSWRKAIKAAGLDDHKYLTIRNYHWTKKKIIRGIQKRYREGKSLGFIAWNKGDQPLYVAVMKRFGSRTEGIKAAGIDPDKAGGKILWTKEKVLRGIRNLHKNGESLAAGYVRRVHNQLFCAAWGYFGGWRTAVVEAGFSDIRQKVTTDVERWLRKLSSTDAQEISKQTVKMIEYEKSLEREKSNEKR